MKYTLSILSLCLIIISCKPKQETAPEDIASIKGMIKEKRTALTSLENEIKELEAKVALLEPPQEKTALVTIDTVSVTTMERYTELQASVMSDATVNAASEIGGRLINVTVKEGDQVNRGQLIATVDIETIVKQKEEIETSLSLAKTVYEKQKKLWDQNIGSEIQYLQAKNNVERLEKSLETIAAQMKKKNVYAPITGVVDREFLRPGEMSAPGMPIVSILNTSQIKVVADVPENYLGKIKKGEKVSIEFPAIEKEISRSVSLIGRSIDPSNRTFKIEMNTDNLGGVLKPNLLAVVKFKDLTIKDAITIPVNLIQEEVNGNQYVYIAKKTGDKLIAAKQPVQTGEVSGDNIQITSGLQPNDIIVVLGARTISEGDNLLIKE